MFNKHLEEPCQHTMWSASGRTPNSARLDDAARQWRPVVVTDEVPARLGLQQTVPSLHTGHGQLVGARRDCASREINWAGLRRLLAGDSLPLSSSCWFRNRPCQSLNMS